MSYIRTPEHRAKMSALKQGRVVSDESRRKTSEGVKRAHAEGRCHGRRKGEKHSDETRAKMRASHAAFRDRFTDDEWTAYIAARNAKGFKWRTPTKLEERVASLFDELGIEYVQQHQIKRSVVDFFIPAKNLVVEVNGCYWHRCKKCGHDDPKDKRKSDKRRLAHIRRQGYNTTVLWEHELGGDLNGPQARALVSRRLA